MQITAAVCRDTAQPFTLETLELESPRANEVLVEIKAAGICHTDVNMRNTNGFTPKPTVLGHEGAGIVRQVGRAVRKVKPGDPVVITFDSCGSCPSCMAMPSIANTWAGMRLPASGPTAARRCAKTMNKFTAIFSGSRRLPLIVSAPSAMSCPSTPAYLWKYWAPWAAASKRAPPLSSMH